MTMTSSLTIPLLEPQLEPTADPRLPELAQLFDRDWVWAAYQEQNNGDRRDPPQGFRVRQFVHSPGRSAFTRYEAQWSPEAYLAPQQFVARMDRDQPTEFFFYPDDRRLPGLCEVADAQRALELANRYVLTVPGRRSRVELITYRPGHRAVLRHRLGRVKLYARVVRPGELPRLLDAYEIVKSSGFLIPNLAGYWLDGAVIWLSQVSGVNLRQLIRKGGSPAPELLLAGLDQLWRRPIDGRSGRAFRLDRAFRSARRSFKHHLRDSQAGMLVLNEAVRSLDPFVRSWVPSATAHNDFYDDQLLVMPDGRFALVDFEEAGPGDPLLDVGNFLAHLRWSTKFSRAKTAEASRRYYEIFRPAALARFGWADRSLSFREAVCLFRVCTNFIRHPQANWRAKLEVGLAMVNDILG